MIWGGTDYRTFLRLLIVLITKRPALWLTSPQREYDVSSIPQDKMVSKIAKKAEELSEKVHPTKQDAKQDKESVRRPILPAVGTRAPLRTHLYPLVASLPDDYQAHPPSLVPELSTTGEIAGEVLSVTAVLVQVILLLRAAVCLYPHLRLTTALSQGTSILHLLATHPLSSPRPVPHPTTYAGHCPPPSRPSG